MENLEFTFVLTSAPGAYTSVEYNKDRTDGYYLSVTYGEPSYISKDNYPIQSIHVCKELPESDRKFGSKYGVTVSTATSVLRLNTECKNAYGRPEYFTQKVGESLTLNVMGVYTYINPYDEGDKTQLRCENYNITSPSKSILYKDLVFNRANNTIDSLTCVKKGSSGGRRRNKLKTHRHHKIRHHKKRRHITRRS